jgi:hypothetical protein
MFVSILAFMPTGWGLLLVSAPDPPTFMVTLGPSCRPGASPAACRCCGLNEHIFE